MAELKLSSNTAKLHQIFGKKLYANKYSFIAELAQNAVDSHRAIGQMEPVIVGIKFNENPETALKQWTFYVKDFGKSFEDKEDFDRKVGTLLESDKGYEKTNDESCQMGAHGIGSIAASAYSNKWTYTVVNNGSKFKAYLQEIEGKGIDLTFSEYEGTEEDKYVLVEVPVPNSDMAHFLRNMKDKLAYFKDILFEFDENMLKAYKELLLINTDFKIFQAEDFQLSTLSQNNAMHVCLDQYQYAINWNTLNIKPIPLDIGLRFGLGDGLEADLTRENLTYNDNYAEIIMAKIKKVADWFVEKYNEGIQDEYTSLIELYKVMGDKKFVTLADHKFEISELLKYSEINHKRLKFKDVSDEVLANFTKYTNYGAQCFIHESTISWNSTLRTIGSPNVDVIRANKQENFFVNKKIPKLTMAYLKDKRPGQANFYRKRKFPLFAKIGASYNSMLNLKHGKNHMAQLYKAAGVNIWREKIKQFQILENVAQEEYFTKIEDVVVPKDVTVKERKKNFKSKEQIGIKYAESRRVPVYRDKTLQLDELHKQPYFHVYGTPEKRYLLDLVHSLTVRGESPHHIKSCIIMKTYQERIKDLKLHNFMEVSEFLAGKHDLFRNMMTSYLIDTQLVKANPVVFNNIPLIEENISKVFAKDLQELVNYTKKFNTGSFALTNDGFIKGLVELTHELKLYDLSIWEKSQKVAADIGKFEFLEFFAPWLNGSQYADNEKKVRAINAMRDVARSRKIRMHWEYYKLEVLDGNA